MVNFVGLFPLSFQDPDRAETSTFATDVRAEAPLADKANVFLNILMQRVAQAGVRPAPKQGVAPLEAPPSMNVFQAPKGSGDGAAGDTAMSKALRFVLEHEGSGYVSNDAGRESSKYGILQATAARCGYAGDVRHLSRAGAEAIYRRMWEESGSGNLPAGLALIHFDTYVNSPQAAKKMLESSGGNTEAYLHLRTQRYARLSTLRPARYAQYLKGWMQRVNDLRTAAAQTGPSLGRAST